MLSRRFPSRPESSASPGAGGAGTAEPEPLSPPPSLLALPSASPLGHELPAHSRRLQAQCPPAAGSYGGGGAAPALSGFFFFCSHPTPPPSLPHPHAQGEGRPSLGSSSRTVSLPCSRRRSPGSILSRRSGEGAAGGRALPLAPLSRRTDGGDSAGLRKDPRSPRATLPGCGALPCAPRNACLRRSHRPRRDGAGHDGVERAGLALDTWCPRPLGRAAPQGVG